MNIQFDQAHAVLAGWIGENVSVHVRPEISQTEPLSNIVYLFGVLQLSTERSEAMELANPETDPDFRAEFTIGGNGRLFLDRRQVVTATTDEDGGLDVDLGGVHVVVHPHRA